jgi:flagellar basal body-associated protein FliL
LALINVRKESRVSNLYKEENNMSEENREDKKKKSSTGKMIAIIAIILVIGGLVMFFVMGAIKKSHEGGPGQGPGQGPGKRDRGAIEIIYDQAEAEDFYIAA